MRLLDNLKNKLLEITDAVYNNFAWQEEDKYIVWYLDGAGNTQFADNRMTEQVLSCTVEYYSKDPKDSNIQAIQEGFSELEVSWYLISIDFNADEQYTRWVWELELI